MYPEKHFKDLESSIKRRKNLRDLVLSSAFITSFLIIGPLIHELGHLAALELANCDYVFSLDFSLLSGLHGEVTPCLLETPALFAFYLSGYAATVLAGAVTLTAGLLTARKKLLGMVSAGMFMSVLLGLGKGDLKSAAELVQAGATPMIASTLLLVIVGVALSMDLVFEKSER